MPFISYADRYTNLGTESSNILAAFQDAEQELSNISAPSTGFLEIYYDSSSGEVKRFWDNSVISSLTGEEQYYYFQQLNGLFNLAVRATLY